MSSRRPIEIQSAAQLQLLTRIALGFITHAGWSPDGAILAVSHGEQVSIWQGGFSEHPTRRLAHTAPVKSFAFTPDGSALVTASSDMLVRLWSTIAESMLITFRGHTDSVEGVAFSPTGRLLASVSADRSVRIVDMTDSIGSLVLHGHTEPLEGLTFSPDGAQLASGGRDGSVRIWDVKNRRELHAVALGDWVRALTNVPGEGLLAAACKDGRVYLIEWESGAMRARILTHEGGVDALAFTPSGAVLATGGRDNTLRLWDWRAERLLAALDAHRKPVLTVAFNPAGTLLLSGSGDNALALWSVAGEI
jgi:WD40 repeat protein